MPNVRHTLLVVDDEPDVVKSVHDLLRLEFDVLTATRADEALRLLDKTPTQVVMSDHRMPEMNGVEFLRRSREKHPEIVRLLFTGYADVRAVIDAVNQGNVYRYITKPWDPDELVAIIREACDRYDLVAERTQLIETLREKNEQLEQANVQLAQADALKAAFIKVVSHELRTPLTILTGVAHLAEMTPGLAAPHAEWVHRMEVSAGRLQTLVNQIVQMLSANHFKTAVNRAPTDLAAMVTQGVDDIRPFIELRQQKLTLELQPDLGTASVDGSKLRDCLNHILLNAIKFTPDGGGITVAASVQDVAAAPSGSARTLKLIVSDTGIGMDAATVDQLFTPFFTEFDVSRHSSGHHEFNRRGLGLGLSIVKTFIDMHDGAVRVDSAAGTGTTVTIYIPLDVADASTAPLAPSDLGGGI